MLKFSNNKVMEVIDLLPIPLLTQYSDDLDILLNQWFTALPLVKKLELLPPSQQYVLKPVLKLLRPPELLKISEHLFDKSFSPSLSSNPDIVDPIQHQSFNDLVEPPKCASPKRDTPPSLPKKRPCQLNHHAPHTIFKGRSCAQLLDYYERDKLGIAKELTSVRHPYLDICKIPNCSLCVSFQLTVPLTPCGTKWSCNEKGCNKYGFNVHLNNVRRSALLSYHCRNIPVHRWKKRKLLDYELRPLVETLYDVDTDSFGSIHAYWLFDILSRQYHVSKDLIKFGESEKLVHPGPSIGAKKEKKRFWLYGSDLT